MTIFSCPLDARLMIINGIQTSPILQTRTQMHEKKDIGDTP